MADSDRNRWEAKHAAGLGGTEPAEVLTEYAYLLPDRGRALDLACGRGANALFLARRGLDTTAWDISTVAIGALSDAARRTGLPVLAARRDVVDQPPPPRSFDVIVVSRFLDRGLIPALPAALRPRGVIFYQTFLKDTAGLGGPRNPAYRLDRNELVRLFASLHVLAYHEGGLPDGRAATDAMLVAQQPGEG